MHPLPPAAITRVAADLDLLDIAAGHPIAVAVSGGGDSVALLLLAHAARPGEVRAATVDHGLRKNSAAEARFVADLCDQRAIPHVTLRAEWAGGLPRSGIQGAAREARYAALTHWCATAGIGTLLTAHHADDQAETLLMRLGRGAGLPGLAGIRPVQEMAGIRIARPLLGWRHAELLAICAEAGVVPVEDPSNADPRHERSRVRALLRGADALDPLHVAASARHLLDVEDALGWLTDEAIRTRIEAIGDSTCFDAAGLPREIQRRVLARIIADRGADARGSAIARCVDRLNAGHSTTVAGLRLRHGPRWTVTSAPPRRAN